MICHVAPEPRVMISTVEPPGHDLSGGTRAPGHDLCGASSFFKIISISKKKILFQTKKIFSEYFSLLLLFFYEVRISPVDPKPPGHHHLTG